MLGAGAFDPSDLCTKLQFEPNALTMLIEARWKTGIQRDQYMDSESGFCYYQTITCKGCSSVESFEVCW
jgi:hypothetical protein